MLIAFFAPLLGQAISLGVFGVSFMIVFKVAGPRGYPFKRHAVLLKRHVNFSLTGRNCPCGAGPIMMLRRRKRS